MNFELLFNQPNISLVDLQNFFLDRFHYRVGDLSTAFHGEESGTAFYFDFGIEIEQEFDKPDPETPLPLIHFDIKCPVPSACAYEAQLELEALCAVFPFRIREAVSQTPQAFDGARFLEACRIQSIKSLQMDLLPDGDPDSLSQQLSLEQRKSLPRLPGQILRTNLEWNRRVAPLREEKGNDPFIPAVFYGLWQGEVISFTTWIDGLPTYLPTVPFVLLERHRLAPRGWLFRKADKVMVPWVTLFPHLERHAQKIEGGFLLDQPLPAGLESELRAIQPSGEPELLPTGLVLDRNWF